MFYRFKPQKFYILEIFFLFIHIGAVICTCYTNLMLLIKMIIISFIFIHYFFLNHFKKSVDIWQNDAGDWYINLLNIDNKAIPVYINSPIFISKHLIILNFLVKKDLSKISIPVTKYALKNFNDFRKLKSIIKTKNLL